MQINENSPINVLNYIKRLESFLNACITFRILLTILVTVAATERSFSKLKLIKSYLRSIMSLERLSKLVILSIDKEMLAELECNSLINNFVSQKVRKINLSHRHQNKFHVWENIQEFYFYFLLVINLSIAPF